MTDKKEMFDISQDEDLKDLFSAFDEIKAPASLKQSTLATIKNANVSEASSKPAPKVTAHAGGKKRGRGRKILAVAVAACLAFGVLGGTAYATPVSYYDISQDDTTATLGINCFGIAVSADADSDAGKEMIKNLDIKGRPKDEAAKQVIGAMEKRDPEHGIEYGPRGQAPETRPPANPSEDETSQQPQSTFEAPMDVPQNAGWSEPTPNQMDEPAPAGGMAAPGAPSDVGGDPNGGGNPNTGQVPDDPGNGGFVGISPQGGDSTPPNGGDMAGGERRQLAW